MKDSRSDVKLHIHSLTVLFSKWSWDVFLSNKECIGLKSDQTKFEENLGLYIKLFVLLYADDTVLFAESANDLQIALNIFSEYCEKWKLKVNISKTKVIFFKGKSKSQCNFKINSANLDVVSEFKYLGILFSNNGRFCKCFKTLYDQTSRAMYAVLRKIWLLDIPIDCQLKLFD